VCVENALAGTALTRAQAAWDEHEVQTYIDM
jgi:hypothetical protein